MFKKSIIALFAAIALFASFDTGAKAQGCDDSANSAYAVMPRC
jgi:hypothetical protein